MAKPRKTDANGQPEDTLGLEDIQDEGSENTEGGEGTEDQDTGAEGSPENTEGSKGSENAGGNTEGPAENTEGGQVGNYPEGTAGAETGETEMTECANRVGFSDQEEQEAIHTLFKSMMGHDTLPEGWSSQNSTKLVRDAWLHRKHGRPFPGYATALADLVKDL